MARPPGSEAMAEVLAMYEVSKGLNSGGDLLKALRSTLGILSSYLHMQRGMVGLVQEDGALQIVSTHGLSYQETDRGRYQRGEGIIGRVLKSGLPIVIPDVANEPLFLNRTLARAMQQEPGTAIAFICVPIKMGRETIGVLSVDRETQPASTPSRFEHDVRFLKMVTILIGHAIKQNRVIAAERAQLLAEKQRLETALKGRYSIDNVVGHGKRMQEVFAEVHKVAPGRATVLLRGESGTGKEMIARAIHYLSPRKDKAFVRVNCAALTETLLESELFGHEKGAFTGASQEHKGRFESAHGGTLFLDEIGEISPAFQTKLLRVLQEREFERVGGNKSIRVDVRIICATNRDLEVAVANGTFREDLYYRINVVAIFLPPLRERHEDIPFLVDNCLEKFNQENGRQMRISPEALRVLLGCNWSGNVRELENCLERSATMAHGDTIELPDLSCQQGKCFSLALQDAWGGNPGMRGESRAASPPDPAARDRGPPGSERERLIWALDQCGWVQAKAARLLNLTPRQIGYALKKYAIPVRHL
ncbi:MAG TPA: nif-specific transcriptional activator NifA [Acidiferrobacter sp.]|nr:nif-specific transcriptional activator NifA [Acidiferrobacter sp.]